ncbi:MAG: helix-turn-helix transcriptional regulator [Clostridia bacterium]|nr:helix-turn-helix transcriptional regulator [Clostridia bacterium]
MRGYTILDAALQSAVFEILFYSQVEHDAGWRERGSKTSCDIWVVRRGSMRVTYKKKTYTLAAGDVFFLEPDVLYSAVGGPQGCAFTFVHFRAQLQDNPNVFAGFDLGGKTEADAVRAEVYGFENALNSAKNAEPMAQFALKAALMRLCARMIALKETKQKPMAPLEQVLNYIDANLSCAPSVSALALQMNMSEKYFISYFKKHMGQTPHAYMTAQKMQRAYAMLYAPDMQVKVVAESLGYCDAYAFSKAFKAYFGISPAFAHKNKGKTKKIFG